ncbi:hypothetical protein Q9L58_005851 [Maublancomyces gigas]|uniref:F-box domain-containing protein n=1 Tax=Discina gigas TaxID=1032678 RepID=A0ABR3GH27_9PEZI
MNVKGNIVYRFRGRHYIITSDRDGNPQSLGQEVLEDIPIDPVRFQDWKNASMTRFRLEEARILALTRASPLREVRDQTYWGYRVLPSRHLPQHLLPLQWIYVIDLDQNVFRIYGENHCVVSDRGVQYFRLDNIPRWLFGLDPVPAAGKDDRIMHPVMTATTATVPVKHWANILHQIPCQILTVKPELLELYRSFSTDKYPLFSVPPGPNIPTWKSLQLQLLHQLLEFFRYSLVDIHLSSRCSNFVRRQLSYAILSHMRHTGMKFNNTDVSYKMYFGHISSEVRTPSWEPPTTDSYWLGDVLILLTEQIYFYHGQPTTSTQAEIARVVQLATTQSSLDTVAVLFAVSRIVIVNIHHTPHGLQVSHSHCLPLVDISDPATGFGTDIRRLTTTRCGSPGIEALMNLFSSRPQFLPSAIPVARPGNLPIELCEQIFRYADHEVQFKLERTCGVFRYIATLYPRIGEWTLVRCTGDNNFVARRGSSQSMHEVRIDGVWKVRGRNTAGRSGFEVGLCGAGEMLKLNVPLLNVVEVVKEPNPVHG